VVKGCFYLEKKKGKREEGKIQQEDKMTRREKGEENK
jgi:hypothetical protein